MKNKLASILLIVTALIVPGGSVIMIGALVAQCFQRRKNGSSKGKTDNK